jgi:hypothetical protein
MQACASSLHIMHDFTHLFLMQDCVMAVSRTACATVLLVVLLAGGAAARKHPPQHDDYRRASAFVR